MPFSEIVIAAGSKALVACLSQYIKYKLKNDCIEKKIITSTSDTFLQYGSDSLIKKITSKLLPQKSLQEKYTTICSNVLNNLINSIKYKKIFEEWSKGFCLNNLPDSETVFYDIESSLQEWFSHHTSLHMDIDDKIKAFITDFNQLTDQEIQKDYELTMYFEIIKNGKNENEILLKIDEIINCQMNIYSLALSNRQLSIENAEKTHEKLNEILELISQHSLINTNGAIDQSVSIKQNTFPTPSKQIEKCKYHFHNNIIERKVISYEYIQESTVYFHENEAKTLLDYCKEERLLVLLGDAGCGKTIVLKQLAAQLYDTEYYPIFISLSDYAGESIEELIKRVYTNYNNINILLIFDAFDETRQEDRDIFARKINSYAEYRLNDRIVISVRNNFYRFSDSDSGGSKFKEFKEIGLCPLSESDISSYVTGQKVDYSCFKKHIISNNLQGLVCNPFYLCMLTELMIQHGELPHKKELMEEIIQDSFKFDSAKYRNPDIINQSKIKLNRLLQEIAFSMQLMNDKSTLSTDDYQCLFEEVADRELLQHSALFTANNNEQWRFEHNNFREYLAAKYLNQQDFETIKNVLCSDKEHTKIRESWLNVISYLVLIHDEDDLLEWLAEISPELLVKFEPSRIDEKDRNQIFQRIFNHYTKKNMYITRGINDFEILVKFSCTEETLLFLINYIDNGSTIWEKANAIKLISYFEGNFYNNEERIRSLLLNNISNGDDYIKAISIEAIGKLKLSTPEITDVIINQFDTLSADSDDSSYIKYMILKYIINSDLYEKYIDLLFNIQEQAVHNHLSHSIGINFAIQDIYPKINDSNAIASIIKHFSKRTQGYYNNMDEKYYKTILKKAVNFYNNGDALFLDIVIEAILESSNYNRSSFDSVYKNFFIETGTLSIAIVKLLSESNIDNRRTLYKAQFFKLFCDNDEMLNVLKYWFYSDSDKNQCYVYAVLSDLQYNSSRYNKYCDFLSKKGLSLPQPPVNYNKIEREGLQEYFDALFSSEKFQNLIDELLFELKDDNLTYENVDTKFFERFKLSTSQSEKLHNIVWTIKSTRICDKSIKNFTSHINNWLLFCIHNVVNLLSSERTEVFISDEQKEIITDYCKKVDVDNIILNGIKETSVSSLQFSFEAYYFCFLSKYFNITYDTDTYKKMTMIPKDLFGDESHDNQAFPQYITEHLTEKELNECVKNNLNNETLSIHTKIGHIQYCKEKHLDYAIDAAEEICLIAEIPYYHKKDAIEYLIEIKHDNHYDYIYSKFLEIDDEELLNSLIQTTEYDNNIRLIKKLETYNSINPDKTKFLIPLINMQSSYALEVYYSLAKKKMSLPDYDVGVSEITEAISNIKYVELLPQIIKLKDLLFSDNFKDKSTFGLQNSLWKALRNIADNNSSTVICELNKCLDNPQISAEEKAFCNNIIEEINISMKYRLDIAWNIRDIKRFLKAHRV